MEEKKTTVEIPSMDVIEAERDRYQHKKAYKQVLKSTLIVLVVAAAIAVLIATLWMPVLQIYGSSMSPTLDDGQIVVTVKSQQYHRGDLVAFYYGNKLLIKRVIAEPGDQLIIDKDGCVFIDGKYLEEPYVKEPALGDCDQVFPLQMNEEHWFLMGDNRSISLDSRSSSIGPVSGEQIVGKIVLRVWPLSAFGSVE